MVGDGPQVLEQQQQSLPQPLSAAEEEAVKRNTDCVYFLASPLTCKKGSECEYRHSEYARVNPRDCWFWLNGNCLNPKCSFRHPPLDGLVGTPHSTNPSSQIPSQTAAIPSTPANSSKQAVPCIFFQKGLCLKGDRCAFSHGPSPVPTNKVPQTAANSQAGEPPSVKKVGTQRSSQEQKIPQAIFSKSICGAPVKLAMKDETVPSKIGSFNKKSGPPAEVADGGSRYKATNYLPILNECSLSKANRLQPSHGIDDHGLQNGKDADEFLKESSPGFDVLVDDELRGSSYYGSEEQYGRARGHEGTNMISMNDYDISHSADYKMMADVDHDVYNDVTDYDYDSRQRGQYGWDQRRTSSEKLSLGSAQMERRLFPKSNSPEHVQNVDLRQRLNHKQRRGNGLRSVISNENAASRPEERNYRPSRRDSLPSQESSMSNRLRGRIKLPVPRITSPVRNSNVRPERDLNRGRPWGRLSPGRSQSLSHQGSTREEMQGRLEEDYNNERRNFNGLNSWRDRMDETSHFAAPKRLGDLKGDKHVMVSNEQQTLGKRKGFENEQSGGELSFKGPKSLSEILKKKRQVKAAVDDLPVNNAERESSEKSIERSTTLLKQETNSLEVTKSAPAETFGQEEKNIDVSHCHSSQPLHSTNDHHEIEAFDETLEEDHEYEGDDQRDGEYEYEHVDEGEYVYEEGENIDPEEEEFMDDEDGDDFAKKIGVMS